MRLSLFFCFLVFSSASLWFQSSNLDFRGSLILKDTSSTFVLNATASFLSSTIAGHGEIVVTSRAVVKASDLNCSLSSSIIVQGSLDFTSSLLTILPLSIFVNDGYVSISSLSSPAYFGLLHFTRGTFLALESNIFIKTLQLSHDEAFFIGDATVFIEHTFWTAGVIGSNTHFTESLSLIVKYNDNEEDFEHFGMPLKLMKVIDSNSNLVIQCNVVIPTDTFLYFSEYSSLFVHETGKLVVGNTVNFSSLHEVNHALFINNGTLQLDISVFYLHPFFINHGFIDLRTCDQWILVLGGLFYQGNVALHPSSSLKTFGDVTFRPPTVLHLAYCYLIQENPEGVILIESSDVLFEDTFLGDTGHFYFANGTNVDPKGTLTCAGGRVFFMDTISTPYLFIDTLLIQGSWVYFYTHRDVFVSNLIIVTGFRAGTDFLTVDTLTWTTGGFRGRSKTLVREWVRGPFGQDNLLRLIIEGSTLISHGNFHQQWRIEADTGSSLINEGSFSILDNSQRSVTWNVGVLDTTDNLPRFLNSGNLTFGSNFNREFTSSWVIDGEIPGEFFINTSFFAQYGGFGSGIWNNAPETIFTLGNFRETHLDTDHFWTGTDNTVVLTGASVFTNGTLCFNNTVVTGTGTLVLGSTSQLCPHFSAIFEGVSLAFLSDYPISVSFPLINMNLCTSSTVIFTDPLSWISGTLCSTSGNRGTFITRNWTRVLTQLPKAVGENTTLILQGHTTLESDMIVLMKKDSSVINEGTLNLCTNSSFVPDPSLSGSLSSPAFINNGILIKDCPGLSEIPSAFYQGDTGVLIVLQGKLRISGYYNIRGTVVVAPDAYLVCESDKTLSKDTIHLDLLEIGGFVSFGPSVSVDIQILVLKGGCLETFNSMYISVLLSWSSGGFNGTGSVFVTGHVEIFDSAFKTLNQNVSLIMESTCSIFSDGPILFSNQSSLIISVDALVTIHSSLILDYRNSISYFPSIQLYGTVVMSSSVGFVQNSVFICTHPGSFLQLFGEVWFNIRLNEMYGTVTVSNSTLLDVQANTTTIFGVIKGEGHVVSRDTATLNLHNTTTEFIGSIFLLL
ncbi:hypothetical protein RCL1_000032 [Eukaryota sp. TZLM3-RCL]